MQPLAHFALAATILTCTLCGRTYDVDDPLTREARQMLVAHHVVRHEARSSRLGRGDQLGDLGRDVCHRRLCSAQAASRAEQGARQHRTSRP